MRISHITTPALHPHPVSAHDVDDYIRANTFLLQSRLFVKGRITGHQRGKRNSSPSTTLIKIEGVEKPEETAFYLGKVSGADLTTCSSHHTHANSLTYSTAHRIYLPRSYRATGLQGPRDLGQGHTIPRQLWTGSFQVPHQHPPQGLRCYSSYHAVPQQHLSTVCHRKRPRHRDRGLSTCTSHASIPRIRTHVIHHPMIYPRIFRWL